MTSSLLIATVSSPSGSCTSSSFLSSGCASPTGSPAHRSTGLSTVAFASASVSFALCSASAFFASASSCAFLSASGSVLASGFFTVPKLTTFPSLSSSASLSCCCLAISFCSLYPLISFSDTFLNAHGCHKSIAFGLCCVTVNL